MSTNETLIIKSVSNGFLVISDHPSTPMSEVMVFQTMAELVIFIQGHFDHRCNLIAADKIAREE